MNVNKLNMVIFILDPEAEYIIMIETLIKTHEVFVCVANDTACRFTHISVQSSTRTYLFLKIPIKYGSHIGRSSTLESNR